MSRFKIYIIAIHVAGWLLFMAFPLLFLNGGGQTNSWAITQSPYYWLFCSIYIALFYINGYFLIPRFLLRKKYIDYAIIAFVLFSCVYVIKPFDKLLRNTDNFIHREHSNWPGPRNAMPQQGANIQQGGPPPGNPPGNGNPGPMPDGSHMPPGGDHHGPPNGPPPNGNHKAQHYGYAPPSRAFIDSNSLFIFLMMMALSTAIKTVQQWQLTEQRAARAEADKASAELSFLKAQINPHFLFNTLNNIYTLAVTHDEYAADSIMKLSNIMRYVTDDVSVDFVPLQSEIDCISDYIELQRLRMNKNTPIDFTIKGDTDGKKIPPLVLMTFIENVFKYGISKHEPSTITINIIADENGISFFCQNKVFARDQETQRMGIGIKNTKQRLEHLYSDRYLLYITNDDELYTVQLNLKARI